jgi:hypothetical protein
LVKFFNCCFIFLSEFYFIQQVSGWKTIGLGKKVGGLYHIVLNNLEGLPTSCVPPLASVSIKPVPPTGCNFLSVPIKSVS